MSGTRVVVVYEECPHGRHVGPHPLGPGEGYCRPVERQLIPGQFVLFERDEDGQWPYDVWSWALAPALADAVYKALDALSDHTEGTS